MRPARGPQASARAPLLSQRPWLISSCASAAPLGGPTFLCHPSTSRWAPGQGGHSGEMLRCRSLAEADDMRGGRTQKWRWEGGREGWGTSESQGIRVSEEFSEEFLCPPPHPRTAWPWPPSSCRPVCSHPSRLPWLPQPPQTAPYNCSSSETAASSAAMATTHALELWDLARGVAWPPLSSSQEQVRG